MAAAAVTFQFSSKLSLFHAVRSPKPCNSSLPFSSSSSSSHNHVSLSTSSTRTPKLRVTIFASSTSSSSTISSPFAKLYVSGLSFRITQEGLRYAFQGFGQLVEANRPRGFAFLRYATEEESKKAIEGMHGKIDGGASIMKIDTGIYASEYTLKTDSIEGALIAEEFKRAFGASLFYV